MHLDQLFNDIRYLSASKDTSGIEINSICSDSRKINTGDMYVALKGLRFDGNDYIDDAVKKGAAAVITDQDTFVPESDEVCIITVENTKETLYRLMSARYGNPSKSVKTIGITGTNGKTTVSYLIESILKADHKACGVIGTINYRKGDSVVEAAQTTPDYVDNQKFLYELANEQIPYCVMEVSSHALSQDRVRGIDFHTSIFTNLTSDHLDYHKTRDQYFATKAQLFTGLDPDATAVINADDMYGQQLQAMVGANIMTYGMTNPADLLVRNLKMGIGGSKFILVYPVGEVEVETGLIGKFNIYNILAAMAFAIAEGIDPQVAAQGIKQFDHVPGRLERVECDKEFSIFIDYAHTEDALSNVLTAVRKVCSGRILLVFGCGGDRDTSKRKKMGQVASDLADYSYVTSDNPRTEDPQAIVDEIEQGYLKKNYTVIVDRKKAIQQALNEAQQGDVVLLAGKGHETYQVLGTKKIDFNEREIIKECLSV